LDPLLLSRVQFGLTAGFHFLFPPVTIGLAFLIAVMELLHWRRGEPIYDRVARFWSRIFIIYFVAGVATGIAIEFQFGTNWSEYAKFVGDIFGAPLAAEGIFAFFLESTFVGLLVFGRDRISPAMRFVSALLVAAGSTLSAFWIIVANSWQQTPVAYRIQGNRAVLTDFLAAVFNPSTMPRYLHTVDASLITGAFFAMGVSAYLLLRERNTGLAKRSLAIALVVAVLAAPLQIALGDAHAREVAQYQPAKLATFEALWNTTGHAPLDIVAIPVPSQSKNLVAIGIPGLLSFLTQGDASAPVTGLNDIPPAERPPMIPTYLSFRVMVVLGMYFAALMLWGLYLLWKRTLYEHRLYLKLLVYSAPLPLVANETGWLAAELGRQPWVVYGVLRTAAAASPLPAQVVLLTTIGFAVIYTALVAGVWYLTRRVIEGALADGGPAPAAPTTEPVLETEVS